MGCLRTTARPFIGRPNVYRHEWICIVQIAGVLRTAVSYRNGSGRFETPGKASPPILGDDAIECGRAHVDVRYGVGASGIEDDDHRLVSWARRRSPRSC